MLKGQIWKINAGFFEIVTNSKQKYVVRGSGKLRNQKEVPVVGDLVEFSKKGFLEKVLPRKNVFVRPKVANIDQVIICSSFNKPRFSSFLLNKMLAIFESKLIHPIIVFTKKDLLKDWELILKEYESQDYQVYAINNLTSENIENLKPVFKNHLSVFAGQTGVGKSSTINNIAKLNLKTQDISHFLNRGKHTTRVVEIFEWNEGLIIDSPGFSSMNLSLTSLELARSYRDFRALSSKCQFPRTCIHYKEPKCAIKENVDKKVISQNRYQDYLKLLKEAFQNEKTSSIYS